jgi:hypothetical protein
VNITKRENNLDLRAPGLGGGLLGAQLNGEDMELSHRRSNLFKKLRGLMAAGAAYLDGGTTDQVVALPARD